MSDGIHDSMKYERVLTSMPWFDRLHGRGLPMKIWLVWQRDYDGCDHEGYILAATLEEARAKLVEAIAKGRVMYWRAFGGMQLDELKEIV